MATLNSHVLSGELEDCLLNSLKGVSSDTAARMVRQACESKVAEGRVNRLIEKHGQRTTATLSIDDWNSWGGSAAQAVISNTASLTALLIEVSLSKPDSQGKCTAPPARKELYRTKLKPGSTGTFSIPDVSPLISKTGSICIDAVMVRGRQPSPFDISIGSFKPCSVSEVEAINDELKESYAKIEPDFGQLIQMAPPASRK